MRQAGGQVVRQCGTVAVKPAAGGVGSWWSPATTTTTVHEAGRGEAGRWLVSGAQRFGREVCHCVGRWWWGAHSSWCSGHSCSVQQLAPPAPPSPADSPPPTDRPTFTTTTPTTASHQQQQSALTWGCANFWRSSGSTPPAGRALFPVRYVPNTTSMMQMRPPAAPSRCRQLLWPLTFGRLASSFTGGTKGTQDREGHRQAGRHSGRQQW